MQNIIPQPLASTHVSIELKAIDNACAKAFQSDRDAEINKLAAVLLRTIAIYSQNFDAKKIAKDVREYFTKVQQVSSKDAYPRAQAIVWAFEHNGEALRMVYAEARRAHNDDKEALKAMLEHTEEVLTQYANTNGRGKVTGLWHDGKILPLLAPEYRGLTWEAMVEAKKNEEVLRKAAKKAAQEAKLAEDSAGNPMLEDFPAISEPLQHSDSQVIVQRGEGFPLADYMQAAFEAYAINPEARLQLDAIRGLFGASDNAALGALPVVFPNFQEMLAMLPSECNPLVKVA